MLANPLNSRSNDAKPKAYDKRQQDIAQTDPGSRHNKAIDRERPSVNHKINEANTDFLGVGEA